jgi:anti-repressor protein
MTSKEIIPINTDKIGDEVLPTVDARKLHEFLDVGKDFSNWIKNRIEQYKFVENQDFLVFAHLGENPQGGRPSKDYHITLDMAKELAMVERNDKGREARKYFIECEKRLKDASQLPASSAHQPIAISYTEPIYEHEGEFYISIEYLENSLNMSFDNLMDIMDDLIAHAVYREVGNIHGMGRALTEQGLYLLSIGYSDEELKALYNSISQRIREKRIQKLNSRYTSGATDTLNAIEKLIRNYGRDISFIKRLVRYREQGLTLSEASMLLECNIGTVWRIQKYLKDKGIWDALVSVQELKGRSFMVTEYQEVLYLTVQEWIEEYWDRASDDEKKHFEVQFIRAFPEYLEWKASGDKRQA